MKTTTILKVDYYSFKYSVKYVSGATYPFVLYQHEMIQTQEGWWRKSSRIVEKYATLRSCLHRLADVCQMW